MKPIYFLLVLGLLVAIAYTRPIEDDEPLEDELTEGNVIKLELFLNFPISYQVFIELSVL